ncbi:hypothetical protein CPB85DRAFT_1257042 [Mucidula mucida]|nr:hypothetical protein CPB85DRAFT_1257042 [Mucidula mucida]
MEEEELFKKSTPSRSMRRLLPALLHGRRVSRRRVSTIGGEEGGRLKEVGVLVRIRWAAVQGANTDSAGVRVEDTEVLSEQCGTSTCPTQLDGRMLRVLCHSYLSADILHLCFM